MRLALALSFAGFLAATLPAADKADSPKPPKGFTALFNGKDLDGWQGNIDMKQRVTMPKEKQADFIAARTKTALEHWSVKDGVIHMDSKGGVSLQTVKDYGNFELYIVDKEGNRRCTRLKYQWKDLLRWRLDADGALDAECIRAACHIGEEGGNQQGKDDQQGHGRASGFGFVGVEATEIGVQHSDLRKDLRVADVLRPCFVNDVDDDRNRRDGAFGGDAIFHNITGGELFEGALVLTERRVGLH